MLHTLRGKGPLKLDFTGSAEMQRCRGCRWPLCFVCVFPHPLSLRDFSWAEMPSFLKTPMDLTIRTGAMARLECAAEGHPAPQISWQKDGGTDFPAARERRMHVMPEDDVFFIANVKIEDMGIYSCMAQNIAGGLSANASLTVLGTCTLHGPCLCRRLFRGRRLYLGACSSPEWQEEAETQISVGIPTSSSPCFARLRRVTSA